MNFIYVTDCNISSTEEFVTKLAVEKFNYSNPIICRNEHGKPYFAPNENNPPLHFSVSHTDNKLFVVFSKNKIGLDVENKQRQVNYRKILRKIDACFPIASTFEFLELWTAKESVVKYFGGTIATDAKSIRFSPAFDCVEYHQKPLPVYIQHLEFENHLVCVCSEAQDEFSICKINLL